MAISSNDKFTLAAKIIDAVTRNIELVKGDPPKPGYRRAMYFHSQIIQLKLIEMIETVYGEE